MSTPKPEADSERGVPAVLLPWEQDAVLPQIEAPAPFGMAGPQGAEGFASLTELRHACEAAVDTGRLPTVWTPESAHLQPASAISGLAEPMLRWLTGRAQARRKNGMQNLALFGCLAAFSWYLNPQSLPVLLLLLAVVWGFFPLLHASWSLYRLRVAPAAMLIDLSRSLRWSYWSGRLRPLGTRIILSLLVAIAALQLFSEGALSLSISRPIASLANWELAGLLSGYHVREHGEWWRLLTGTLLHGGLVHIAFNGFFLWHVGGELEKLIGRWQLVTVCLLTGLGGALASVWWNPEVVSLGFSGSLCGLLGVQVAMALRYPRLPPGLGRLAFINAGLIVGIGFIGQSVIDNAGHAGGFLVGLGYGFLLFARLRPLPIGRHRLVVLAGSASAMTYLAALGYLLYCALVRYPVL